MTVLAGSYFTLFFLCFFCNIVSCDKCADYVGTFIFQNETVPWFLQGNEIKNLKMKIIET